MLDNRDGSEASITEEEALSSASSTELEIAPEGKGGFAVSVCIVVVLGIGRVESWRSLLLLAEGGGHPHTRYTSYSTCDIASTKDTQGNTACLPMRRLRRVR